MKTDCRFEIDVQEAVFTGRWPAACDAALRAHVSECATCAELVQVMSALAPERDTAVPAADAHVPNSAQMWWRAQMRARQEAARAATRPIWLAQALAVTTVVSAGIALAGVFSPWFRAWLHWLVDLVPSVDFHAMAAPAMAAIMTPWTLLVIGAVVVLTPVALYVAFSDE